MYIMAQQTPAEQNKHTTSLRYDHRVCEMLRGQQMCFAALACSVANPFLTHHFVG